MDRLRRLAGFLRRTPLHPQWLISRERRAMAGLLAGARGDVLDIGCADQWTRTRLPTGCHYVGVDSIGTGRGMYGARPSVFADAAGLPFADGSFDTVLLFEVLEHLAQPERSLAEIQRVLRPGGVLLASVPFLYPIHDAPHDFQRYTRHGLAHAVDEAGLELAHLAPRLDALSSAALLANLAFGGMAEAAIRRPGPRLLLVPLLLLAVVAVNVAAFLLRPFCPNWPAMTNGYLFVAARPQ